MIYCLVAWWWRRPRWRPALIMTSQRLRTGLGLSRSEGKWSKVVSGGCGHYNLRRANNKFMHFCYCPGCRQRRKLWERSWMSTVGRVLIQVNCRRVIVVVSNCVGVCSGAGAGAGPGADAGAGRGADAGGGSCRCCCPCLWSSRWRWSVESGTTMCLICADNLQASDAVARQIIASGRVWSMHCGYRSNCLRSSILRQCQWLHSVVIIVVWVATCSVAQRSRRCCSCGLHFKLLSIYTSLALNYPYTKCSAYGQQEEWGGGALASHSKDLSCSLPASHSTLLPSPCRILGCETTTLWAMLVHILGQFKALFNRIVVYWCLLYDFILLAFLSCLLSVAQTNPQLSTYSYICVCICVCVCIF